MNRILGASSLILLIVLCGCASEPQETVDGRVRIEQNLAYPNGVPLTDAEIQQILDDNVGIGQQSDGLVAGIIDEHGPRVISAGSLGDATGRRMDGDTVFEIGSITKVFTGLLLQDMVERGQMKLDDPVQNYLPDALHLPTWNGKPVTIFDLATHTSGLPRDASDLGGPTDTPEHLFATLSHGSLRFEPGTNKVYSNLGVALLGYAIACKAGQDYETLVLERICRPLAMQSTRVSFSPEIEARAATGHAFPGRPVAHTRFTGILVGAGSIRSTANDLLKFVSAYLGYTSTPITPLAVRSYSIQKLPSGRSDRLVWEEDGGVIVHGGLIGGFRTNLGFDPVSRRGVVILANCATSRAPFGLLGVLLRNRSPRPRDVATLSAERLDDLVGEYRFSDGATCLVRRDADRLLLQTYKGQPRYPIPFLRYEVFPQSQTVFFSSMWDVRATFELDRQGKPIRLFLDDPREPAKPNAARRISPAAAPPPAAIDPGTFAGVIGRYRPALLGILPVGPTLSIYPRHDDLGQHLVAFVQASGGQFEGDIHPWDESTFFSVDVEDCSLTMRRRADGKAKGIQVHFQGQDIYFQRIADQPYMPPG